MDSIMNWHRMPSVKCYDDLIEVPDGVELAIALVEQDETTQTVVFIYKDGMWGIEPIVMSSKLKMDSALYYCPYVPDGFAESSMEVKEASSEFEWLYLTKEDVSHEEWLSVLGKMLAPILLRVGQIDCLDDGIIEADAESLELYNTGATLRHVIGYICGHVTMEYLIEYGKHPMKLIGNEKDFGY